MNDKNRVFSPLKKNFNLSLIPNQSISFEVYKIGS